MLASRDLAGQPRNPLVTLGVSRAATRRTMRCGLARASAGTRRAVESAAVIGARVEPSLLAWLLADAQTSTDECIATGTLIPDGTGLRFRHELVRMAVEAGITPHRKTELHTRLLAALEERGDADPALLAHHAEGAGDEQAVLRHAPEAAVRSAALGHTARRRHSMNGRCVLQKIPASRRWRPCTRGRRPSTHCWTGEQQRGRGTSARGSATPM